MCFNFINNYFHGHDFSQFKNCCSNLKYLRFYFARTSQKDNVNPIFIFNSYQFTLCQFVKKHELFNAKLFLFNYCKWKATLCHTQHTQ